MVMEKEIMEPNTALPLSSGKHQAFSPEISFQKKNAGKKVLINTINNVSSRSGNY